VWGYAMVVSRRDWMDLMPGQFSGFIGDAETYCFKDVVSGIITLIEKHSLDTNLAFVFDNRPERMEENEAHYRHFQSLTRRAQLAGISFLDNEKFVPLQGADMWAWEIFYLATNNLSQGRRIAIFYVRSLRGSLLRPRQR
jgi:hypothetical protein